MSTLQDRIKEIMASRPLKQVELAELAGVSRGAVSQWVNGPTQSIDPEPASRIEKALGYSATWVSTGNGPKFRKEASNITDGPLIRHNRGYPLISFVQAGSWSEICDHFQPGDADEWKACHKDLGKCGYVLRVSGQSMTANGPDARYSFPEGMLLYVNPDIEATPGKFVVVRRDGDQSATFKKLVLIDGELYLEAINPSWPNRFIKLQKGDTFCGVVVHAGFDMP